ncbi:IDEAL domain-containing protein [Peribacillus sp. B-H-3]|jgi:uncharacterized protein YpiB (UPF0302 family)|uniref:IDEAL domain-containing protein n=1 Tax=Peribacillus sp. B-H-3 TaxID=3400420 RepID=UPI003B022BBD
MNSEYNSKSFKHDRYIASLTEELLNKEDLKTKEILTKERTEYTRGADAVIKRVQRKYLEERRYIEIDKALDDKNEVRFLALTSKGWEHVLS